MKAILIGFIAIILLLPLTVHAEEILPITIEGVIGDFAKDSKIYEINGQAYKLPPNIIIENQNGKRLTFDHLQGGTHVKIYGEKKISLKKEKTKFQKIVVDMKHNSSAKKYD